MIQQCSAVVLVYISIKFTLKVTHCYSYSFTICSHFLSPLWLCFNASLLLLLPNVLYVQYILYVQNYKHLDNFLIS